MAKNNDKEKQPAASQATQSFVPIAEIRNNTIVLNDGSLRQILKVTPISIELRNPKEQDAVIYQFASFLNSLKFPIQVSIQSRRIDLGEYLNKLESIATEEKNELLQLQLKEYTAFIGRLSEEVNIMDRSFYITVPHAKTVTETTLTNRTWIDKLLGGKKTKQTVYTMAEFSDLTNQLAEKVQVVISRLSSLGVQAKLLPTEELIELFYNTYNPEESATEHLGKTGELTTAYVQQQPTATATKEQTASVVQKALEDAKNTPTPSMLGEIKPNEESGEEDAGIMPVEGEKPTITSKKTLSQILGRIGFGPPSAEQARMEEIRRGITDILDIISPAGLQIAPSYLQIGSFFARTLFVFTYPRYLVSGWLSPILNLDATIDISMFFYPIETSAVVNQLRRKTTQLQSSLQIEQEKGLVRNPELETAIGDIEELRDTLQKGETRLFQFSLYFTLYAKTQEELQRLTKRVETTLGGMMVYTKGALLQAETGFNTTLPLGYDELAVVRNLDTESLATTFPFSSQDISHHDGVLYGLNLYNSSLILFDRFKMENANMVVFAKSGAGKSYAIKLETIRSLMLGTEVIIIDPEDEYKALCQTIGGSYIELSLSSTQKINPFDLPHFSRGTQDTGEDVLRSTIAGLHGLLSLMAGGLSPAEDAILDKALYETYALKDINIDPKTQNNPPPLLSDLVAVLANLNGAEDLINRLLKYSEGSFSNLFDSPTNIDLTNRATVFSIRNMEDDLRPLAMYLVLHYIWSRVKSKLKKRMLVIDEAWWMMRFEDTAKFLNAMTKRARKYYLGVTVISQDVEDFVENDYGKAIISNSATQLLMGQSPTAVDKLASVFKLTDGEKQFLQTAEVGVGLFVAGRDRAAMEIIASYTEDQFITTNPEQILMMFGQEVTNK